MAQELYRVTIKTHQPFRSFTVEMMAENYYNLSQMIFAQYGGRDRVTIVSSQVIKTVWDLQQEANRNRR